MAPVAARRAGPGADVGVVGEVDELRLGGHALENVEKLPLGVSVQAHEGLVDHHGEAVAAELVAGRPQGQLFEPHSSSDPILHRRTPEPAV